MVCSNCKKTINGIVKFCPHCGKEQSFSEAKSIYLRGMELFEGGNQKGAKECFEKADALGFPPATNMIGACVEMNYMSVNYRDCVHYYERAAHTGSIAGMANLGRCQWGIQPTNDRATLDHNTEYWLTQAAERGFVGAMISLAVFYSLKKNAKEMAKTTYKWVSIAANAGSIKGKQLKMIMDNGICENLDRRGVEGVTNFEYQSDGSNIFKDVDLDAWERKDDIDNASNNYDDSNNPYKNQNNITTDSTKSSKSGLSFNGVVSTAKNISDGAIQGAKVGSTIPGVGTKIGAVIGGIFGGLFRSSKK